MTDILVIFLLCIIITLLTVHILPEEILFYAIFGLLGLAFVVLLYPWSSIYCRHLGFVYNAIVLNSVSETGHQMSESMMNALNKSMNLTVVRK